MASIKMQQDTDADRIAASAALRDACEKVTHPHEKFESSDFDLHETKQYVDHVTSMRRSTRKLKAVLRWVILIGIGVGTSLCAIVVDACVDEIWYLRQKLVDSVEFSGAGIWLQYIAYVVPCILLTLVGGLLVCFVEPLAGGSGIPEVKSYLNGVHQPGVLEVPTLIAKAVGIIFSVSAGLPCGKEGPMIHIGACLAGLISRNAVGGSVFQTYRADIEVRDMVVAGAASGVAAAFSAPLGGVMFALEEGASFYSPELMLHIFVCCIAATVITHFYFSGMEGSWGDMSSSAPVSFGEFYEGRYRIWELPIFALLGVVGGLSGALFNTANLRLSRWRKAHIGPRGWRRLVEVMVVTFFVASVMYLMPFLFVDTVKYDQLRRHERHATARLYRMLGTDGIERLFHTDLRHNKGELFMFGVVHYMLACLVYGLGVPSGLFVPSLLTGASFGRLVGELIHVRGLSDPGVYALIGATAMLSGMARITISLAVILIEASGSTEWALPIFITTMVSKWTGDLFTIGLYDIHLELKKVPLLELSPEKETITLQARDVMAADIVSLQMVEPVRNVLDTLYSCNHHGFPVLAKSGNFAGLVRRSTLMHVLSKGGVFGIFQDPEAPLQNPAPCMPYHDVLDNVRYSLGEVRRGLSQEELDRVVDLAPFVNRGCYTVPEHSALMRVHMLFRSMGLRHLPVVSDVGKVSGMITRKDLVVAQEHVQAVEEAVEAGMELPALSPTSPTGALAGAVDARMWSDPGMSAGAPAEIVGQRSDV
mmetsp:Transcript_36640/g.85880  ORF Transcript_36640/g.85880 Transcript_36640/m.85880 type:complete len:764 (-) Transcript_36640:12-2303(-)